MRAIWIVAALAFVGLAGCTDESAPAAIGDEPELFEDIRPELGALTARLAIDLGSGAEPNMLTGTDGALYVGSPYALDRSTDGGATWTRTANTGIDGQGDADYEMSPDGSKLYWLGLFGESGPIPFQISTDQGESWSEGFDVSNGTGSDREWLDVTAADHIYTTWRGDDLEFRASLDGGETWQDKVRLGDDANQGNLIHHPGTGVLYNPVAEFPNIVGDDAWDISIHRSRDEGQTWETFNVATTSLDVPAEPNGYVTDFPIAAVDSAGTVYVSWSADQGLYGPHPPRLVGVYGIYISASHDEGETWSEPMLVSTPGKAAVMPWIVAGGPGRVAAVWYENENGLPSETLPDLWNVQLWESVTADMPDATGVMVTLTQEPNHIGQICTSGTGCAAFDRSLLDFIEVDLDHDGHPVAAWAASTLGIGLTGQAADGPNQWFGGVSDGPDLLDGAR